MSGDAPWAAWSVAPGAARRLRTVAAALVVVFTGMFASPARAQEPVCQPLTEVPETLQVAWVSRVAEGASAKKALAVVRVADLRKRVEASGRDPTKLLRALGLIGKRATAKGNWKVTIFDVKREWLCRPVEGPEEVTIAGTPACPASAQKRPWGIKVRSWSGCGYLLDTESGARTLDVYRVQWQDAVAWGFCVLPLRRFLDGA